MRLHVNEQIFQSPGFDNLHFQGCLTLTIWANCQFICHLLPVFKLPNNSGAGEELGTAALQYRFILSCIGINFVK